MSMSMNVGGQAVIEGVMIRSPERVSTAVRRVNGSILVKDENFRPLVKRYESLDIPVVRGALSFFEMLLLGIKTLNFSAEVAAHDSEEKPSGKTDRPISNSKGFYGLSLVLTALLAVVLGVAVFFFTPLVITSLLGIDRGALPFNFVAGMIRMAMFILYIYALSRFKEFRRIFEYHGAEHKSIFAYELDQDLTVSNARMHSTKHPRCGTSFILIVVLFAILVYSISDTVFAMIVGRPPVLLERFTVHLMLLPLVAGGSYELLKLSSKARHHPIVAALVKPGLILQRITTQEPDDQMLEVALCALSHSVGKPYPGAVIYDGKLESVRIRNESVSK